MGTALEIVSLCFFGLGAVAAVVTAVFHSPDKPTDTPKDREPRSPHTDQGFAGHS